MKEKEHFLDKNTLIAIILVFIGWFAWDAYMKKKYPSKKKNPVVLEEEHSKKLLEKGPEHLSVERGKEKEEITSKTPLQKPEKEQLFSFHSESLSFDISSTGMGFKNLVLSNILDRKEKAVWLFSEGGYLPFETRLKLREPRSLYFKINKLSDYSWEGQAVWNGVKVEKTLSVDPDLFLVKAQVEVSGNLDIVSGISTFLVQTQEEQDQKKNFFSSLFIQPDFLSFFVFSPRGFEQIPLVSKEDSQVQEIQSQQPFSSVRAVAIGTKYFGQAWMEGKSDVLPQVHLDFKNGSYMGLINHSILNPQRSFKVSYKMFLGPKDFSLLKKEYPELIRWVDFGWFGFLSRFILQILQLFYSLVNNWGVSIILLTLFVRLLLLPFVLSSHRSMEMMKQVQPEIKKIREKFKKDPQRMNQEVMAVMKSHRVNPLGGCLPLLLQIPVFWALWRALSNSYSLYRAPFILWIEDLSWKDPYYVLPVLMGFFMFVQQKISPVTMNKEMVRVMQIMPVFMTLFMINLPSGLVLYMLVSTVFGLAQQLYLNKERQFSVSLTKLKENKDKK